MFGWSSIEKDRQLAHHARMSLLFVPAGVAVPRHLERVTLAVLLHEVDDGKAAVAEFLHDVPAVNNGAGRQPDKVRDHCLPSASEASHAESQGYDHPPRALPG